MSSRPPFDQTSSRPTSYPSLMDLPPELRVMIWNYLLILNHRQIEICPPNTLIGGSAESRAFRRKRVIAVLRTSSTIYHETMPIFYLYNTLYFKFSHYFELFLKFYNPKCLQFITSIRLRIVGPNPTQSFKALLLCEQLRYLRLDTYGGKMDGAQWHERHRVGSRGMKDLLKLRGLISVKVTRFAEDEDDDLSHSIDLQEYERLCTALEVLKQPKVLQTQSPVRQRRRALAIRKQPKRAVKGKRTNL